MKKQKRKNRTHHFISPKRAISIAILALFTLISVVVIALVSYNIGYDEAQNEVATKLYKAKEEQSLLRERLKQSLRDTYKERDKNTFVESEDHNRMKHIDKVDLSKFKVLKKKPKLALIFDDVSYPSEVAHVKALGLKVNLSFFPVAPKHPLTAEMASRQPFYMVHLPLEAMNFHAEEPNTLRITDSFKTIYTRLKAIKKDFPRLKYMNNHTGSKFTSNEAAVTRLIKAARRLDMEIVDSRTIASTKIPTVYNKYHIPFFQRDVFLDHKSDVNYICGQIKEAVAVAIHKGKAIAIGHPRPHTLKALRKCKGAFDAVELVYIKDL